MGASTGSLRSTAARAERNGFSQTAGSWQRFRISASRPSLSWRMAPTRRRSCAGWSSRARVWRGLSWRALPFTRFSSTSWVRRRRRQPPFQPRPPKELAPVHKVWAVIRREFVERVRTRWFWISAILGPVLFGGVIVYQIMQSLGGGVRDIAVVDSTTSAFGQRVTEALAASPNFRVTRVPAGPRVVDSLTRLVESKQLNGFLIISNDLTETGKAEYRASNLSLQTVEGLERALNKVAVKVRLETRGVNPAVVDWAQGIRITLDQTKIARGRTTKESAGESFVLAYVMAVLLFMAILLYGVNVMSSVLEEKTTRIVEVLVSSLRPFQLMLGKVLGVGAVSIFQFLIWGISAWLLFTHRPAFLTGRDVGEADQIFQVPHVSGATAAVFITYFLGGFFLYSAMFAAVGAISSSEQEARQAQQPISWLLVL